MDVTFLEANIPLRKKFDEHGKHSYPHVSLFTSHTLSVDDTATFHYLIQQQAQLGRCLLKGALTRPLANESRAGTTHRDTPTASLCLDADGLTGVADANDFLARLGLTGYSYILQWSSSSFLKHDGIVNTDFNAHIFMMLDEPVSPHILKLWLKKQNLDTFSKDLALTASDVALKWGLDVTTCQNDKLIYIAPPDVQPPFEDTITNPEDRITHHAAEKDKVPATFFTDQTIDPDALRQQELDTINSLRLAKGLDKKRATFFNLKGTNVEYLANPGKATITGVRQDRGFVYFNLNGGDSWAYYHPDDNFEFIYNFKGEPTYRTAELLPAYYRQKTKELGREKAGGRIPVGFRGLQDGAMYNGFYDENTDTLELHMARRAADVILFLAEYGIVVESLPTFRLIHDPHNTGPRIDLDRKTVNLFTVSELERAAEPNSEPTPTIDRVIEHVVGANNVAHFINWLAYVVQAKTATGTGWVFHGSQGTGKGILFHRVLRPMLGYHNAKQLRTANFEDNYNAFLENSILINVDEVDIPESRRDKMIMADIKNYMTERTISIRKMYSNVYEVMNRTNWIFNSNKRNPIIVEQTDRRFNIADYQREPLIISDDELKQIEEELPAFMHHILIYPADETKAKTAAITAAKIAMQELSETSIDQIANALIEGRAEVLYGFCDDESEVLDLDQRIVIQRYNELVRKIVCDGLDRFTRSDLKVIFEATSGRVPNTPAKFTKFLKHHGIDVGLNKIDGVPQRGSLVVEWRDSQDWFTRTRRDYGVMKAVETNVEPVTGETSCSDSSPT